jgi:hypothetical protein
VQVELLRKRLHLIPMGSTILPTALQQSDVWSFDNKLQIVPGLTDYEGCAASKAF